jgi:hypothetical protein
MSDFNMFNPELPQYIPVQTEPLGGYLGKHEKAAIAEVLANRGTLPPLRDEMPTETQTAQPLRDSLAISQVFQPTPEDVAPQPSRKTVTKGGILPRIGLGRFW